MGSGKAAKSIALFDKVQLDDDLVSDAIDMSRYDSANIKIQWDNTLTPIGLFAFQIRNAETDEWFDLNPGEEIIVPMVFPDETDKFVLNITELDFKWLRLVYTRTSGDGVMSAVMFAKSEGV